MEQLATTTGRDGAATGLPIHVLVVDDQEVVRELFAEIANSLRFRASMAAEGTEALRILESDHVDILLADLKMPVMCGMELLERVKSLSPQTQVVIITAYGSVPSAVQAVKLGAYDYLTKPCKTEEVKLLLERIAKKLELENDNRFLRDQLGHCGGYGPLIGRSSAMQKLFKMIVKVSQVHCPVLIQGESGTGKELVARSIHQSGPRAAGPFVAVDCSALVPTLIESELFGYTHGAFTGAVRSKKGLLETARGGTVFLDEIGELPVDLQAKLLRALQEKEIRPVGGTQPVKFDARIIAATNRDLKAAVQQGNFRKDLYFRLNVVTVALPPLRKRKNDIPLLLSYFLKKFRTSAGSGITFAQEAMDELTAYDWPGNVRELENYIERTIVLEAGPIIHRANLSSDPQSSTLWLADAPSPTEKRVIPLRDLALRAILHAIGVTDGDKQLAADLLGIGKTTLYRKLKEHGKLPEV